MITPAHLGVVELCPCSALQHCQFHRILVKGCFVLLFPQISDMGVYEHAVCGMEMGTGVVCPEMYYYVIHEL